MNLHLPIHDKRAEIVETIRSEQVTVIVGDTGSGKTTHLPLFCREAGRGTKGKIACTQPRRVAAVSLARYVASLMGEEAGGQIGYRVRFDDRVSPESRVVFMTDGILLNDIARDPLLRDYDTVIIDEAHERTVTIDFLLGYFRTLLYRRPDLRLIIASATLDTGLFSRAFHHAPIIAVSGRSYPVEIRYQPMLELWNGEAMGSYLDGVITVVRDLVQQEPEGDILIFLPTIQDIQDTIPPLQRLVAAGPHDRVLPLHSRLQVAEQQQVFARSRGRTIIVATNIAETSITVPGIRFVVDAGLARTLRYEHALGVTRMPIERISRSSADQRAGRCGRVRDGICIRLYSEQDYLSRPRFTTPEIRRANLAGVILRMVWLHLGKPEKFPFLQRPTPRALAAAWRQLRALGAVDSSGSTTGLGRKMARLPLDPPIARMLLHARHERAVREVAVIAAALSVGDPRLSRADTQTAAARPSRRNRHDSDFMTFVNLWDALHAHAKKPAGHVRNLSRRRLVRLCDNAGLSVSRVREWLDVHQQIERILRRIGGFRLNREPAPYEAVHKSLLSGLAGNIAHHEGNGLYRGVHQDDIALFPGSILYGRHPRWIMFHEIVETKRLYGRTAASIEPSWLEELFADRCTSTWHDSHYDEQVGTVQAREEVTFDGFPLVRNRWFDLATRDRGLAHDVFIREALVEERAGDSWRFVGHNRAIRDSIDLAERKLRTRSLYAGDETLEQFYRERLPDVCSVRELSRAIAREGNDGFLCAGESDLPATPIPEAVHEFPDTMVVADTRVRCEWRFAPGEPDDGVTVQVPEALFDDVPLELWAWLLPALSRRRVEHVVDMVVEQREEPAGGSDGVVLDIMDALAPEAQPFMESLRSVAAERLGRVIEDTMVSAVSFPAHLWPRIVVVGTKGVVRAAFRAEVETPSIPIPKRGIRASRWAPWCDAIEHSDVNRWPVENVPRYAVLEPPGQLVAVRVYPGLHQEQANAAVRVFWSEKQAAIAHATAVRNLLENTLADELAWSVHSVEVPEALHRQCRDFTSREELEQTVERLVVERVLRLPAELPRDKVSFEALAASAAEKVSLSAEQALGLISAVADGYSHCVRKLEKMVARYPGGSLLYRSITEELYDSFETYIGMLFDDAFTPWFLDGLPRYLLAFEGRIETAFLDPRRYKTVMADMKAFRTTLHGLQARPDAQLPSRREQLERYAQWIEELAVAQFGRSKVKPLLSVTPEGLAARGRELMEAS